MASTFSFPTRIATPEHMEEIMDFFSTGPNFGSLLLGAISFIVIGIFHPIVIKCEYHFSKRIWPLFLAFGILLAIVALHIQNMLLSVAISLAAFSCLWSIRELFEQEGRVVKGWFPENPKRAAEYKRLREARAGKRKGAP